MGEQLGRLGPRRLRYVDDCQHLVGEPNPVSFATMPVPSEADHCAKIAGFVPPRSWMDVHQGALLPSSSFRRQCSPPEMHPDARFALDSPLEEESGFELPVPAIDQRSRRPDNPLIWC